MNIIDLLRTQDKMRPNVCPLLSPLDCAICHAGDHALYVQRGIEGHGGEPKEGLDDCLLCNVVKCLCG